MSDVPDTIWAQWSSPEDWGRWWEPKPQPDAVEYVRADRIRAVEAERNALLVKMAAVTARLGAANARLERHDDALNRIEVRLDAALAAEREARERAEALLRRFEAAIRLSSDSEARFFIPTNSHGRLNQAAVALVEDIRAALSRTAQPEDGDG